MELRSQSVKASVAALVADALSGRREAARAAVSAHCSLLWVVEIKQTTFTEASPIGINTMNPISASIKL